MLRLVEHQDVVAWQGRMPTVSVYFTFKSRGVGRRRSRVVLGLPKKAARDTPGAISLHQREQGRLQVAPGSGAVGSRAAVLTEFEQRRLLRVYRSLALLAAEPHEFAATGSARRRSR